MHDAAKAFIDDWTAAERSEYQRLRHTPAAAAAGLAPLTALAPLVRETLLALRSEAADDDDVTRALGRFGADPVDVGGP